MDKIKYLEMLARNRNFEKRRFCVRLYLPRYDCCDFQLVQSIYPLTLREILLVRRDLQMGRRIDIRYKPVRQRCEVLCTFRFKTNKVDCECYSCARMR